MCPPAPRSPHAFSLVEMLVALAIGAMLLTATLGALDASWRSYKQTTESASTHVVTRIVVTRLLAMIRTGTEFGPYPADVFDPQQNPVPANHAIEFLAEEDRLAGNTIVTRIERRTAGGSPAQYELWYMRLDAAATPPAVLDERPMLRDLTEVLFILEYEPGPRLVRATIDLTIQPNDDREVAMGLGSPAPQIRLVASAVPRQIN